MHYLAVIATGLLAIATAHCPNMCSGHGQCTGVNRCECNNGWEGGDCSLKKCPMGSAWADIAIEDDVAHAPAVCSNRGSCDTRTGQCQCEPGYEGASCSRMRCPDECGSHGQCLSMRQHAARFDRGLQQRPYYTYSVNWDADMIYGCSCDDGYEGWQCQDRECPLGDDPMTASQADEVQLFRCELSGADNVNRFTFQFRGATTKPFAPSIRAEDLKLLLQELPTIGEVSVLYSSGFTFCDDSYAPQVPASGNAIAITFITEHGDVPSLVLLDEHGQLLMGADDNAVEIAVDGASIFYNTDSGPAILSSITGDKENAPCSNRGTCDRNTGQCRCFLGFRSSDGKGRAGNRGDCGYPALPVVTCPGKPECSGHGTCSGSPEYTCTCYDGWQGGDCGERACPKGKAWFDFPHAPQQAHAEAECSNRGACGRRSGECNCQEMFTGAACERMLCPTNKYNKICSGHGRCVTQSELAHYATQNGDPTPYTYGEDPNDIKAWDGKSVYGCLCEDGYTGYDCSQSICLSGFDIALKEENPLLTNEEQALFCKLLPTAVSPTFRLAFRKEETASISPSATASDVKAALEAMTGIGTVDVEFENGATAVCSAVGSGTETRIRFITVSGDVPPIRVVMDASLTNDDGTFNAGDGWTAADLEFTGGDPDTDYTTSHVYVKGPTTGYVASGIRALEVTKGTSSYTECSSRGLCNRATGQCECFLGYGASDGNRGPGGVENCGWREEFQHVRGPHKPVGW